MLRVALAGAVAAVATSCVQLPSDVDLSCAPGPGRPVSVELLTRTLARHGFELVREEDCSGGEVAILVTARSRSHPADDTDTSVICNVYPGENRDRRPEFNRIKYPDDDWIHMRAYNFTCSVAQLPDAAKWEREADRLERAIRELMRRCGSPADC